MEFDNKEEMDLYRNYHTVFHGWDKAQKWVYERFIKEEERKYIVSEQEKSGPNKTIQKWYLVRPEWNFIDVQVDPKEAIVIDWHTLRIKRDWMLKETDFSQLADAPMNNAEKGKYREYRHYLRNIPLNFNEESIGRAVIMSFEDWKEFFRK